MAKVQSSLSHWMKRLLAAGLVFVLSAGVSWGQPNLSRTPRLDAWMVDGEVNTIVIRDKVAYVGGSVYRFLPPEVGGMGAPVERGLAGALDVETGIPTGWDAQ